MTEIIVGVDGSDSAADALRWAAREAQLRQQQLVAVLAWGYLDQHPRNGSAFDPSYGEDDARAALEGYVEAALGRTDSGVTLRVRDDLPAPALLDDSQGASLLVVGARGLGGFKGLLLGSVSQHCLHHARCPIAIIRGGTYPATADRHERIIVGVDGSEGARRALRWAVEEARLRDASLVVVHAWQTANLVTSPYLLSTVEPKVYEDAARQTLEDVLAHEDTGGLRGIERTLPEGGAASVILDAANEADLVVLGSRGLGGFTGLLLGSVSHHVAHHAPCPVVIVPGEG